MIALLAIMIAVLTLISGLLAIALAILGFWGWNSLKKDAKKVAEKTARDVAQQSFSKELDKLRVSDQTAALSEQESNLKHPSTKKKSTARASRKKNDSELKGDQS